MRVVIDRFEEGFAVLELYDGKKTVKAPGELFAGAKEGDTLSLGDRTYLLRRVEYYYFGNQPIYQWGICVEKGVNDTWGSQS